MIAFERVLCPVDLSDASLQALNRAVTVGRWFDAPVTALHVHAEWPQVEVIPTLVPTLAPPRLEPEAREHVTTAVAAFVGRRERQDLKVHVEVAEAADVAGEIVAQTGPGTLLVIGTHGRSGFSRVMLGSIADKVIRKARCPVLVIPPHDARPPDAAARPQRLLCPVDFSEGSLAALRHAVELAEELNAHLTILHAIEVPPELNELPTSESFNVDEIRAAAEAHVLTRLRDLVPAEARTYCTIETAAVEGKASREILRRATEERADLIVMGVDGRSAFDLWVFGSNTQLVARAATCPVLVVRR